jgi:DNA-binding MarR family transcriptional regulator
MIDFESQSTRTLLAFADQRCAHGAARCAFVFAHLGAADRIRDGLRSALARHRLSELEFAILVLLFEAEPEPVPMALLARHAGVSRPAVTEAVAGLVESELASRARDCRDRRSVRGRITEAGRQRIDRAINDYLQAATHAASVERPDESGIPGSHVASQPYGKGLESSGMKSDAMAEAG